MASLDSRDSRPTTFSPQQIICIEAPQEHLYGAVIQFIEPQDTYWIRPLCLVRQGISPPDVISLHRTSDMIIAAAKLREAWDTEILEFWSALYDETTTYEDNPQGRRELHRFLRQEMQW